ncbi:hypothetical protein Q604_UNBC10064G0002, partial [human gut metagenome]
QVQEKEEKLRRKIQFLKKNFFRIKKNLQNMLCSLI